MNLLEQKNWYLYAILTIFFPGILTFILAGLMDLYEEDAWYTKWYNWAIGGVLFLLPALIMVIIFNIEMQIKICKKLEVKGENIYGYPYLWILCVIVPIIGWASLIVMGIHIYFYPAVMIYEGKGEKYL